MYKHLQAADSELDAIVRTLVERLLPLRIALFGSRARGDGTAASDYDLMLEVEPQRRADADRLVSDLIWEQGWRADIIVTTPAQYSEDCDDVGLVAYQIERDGRLLYARGQRASGQRLRTPRVREPGRRRPRSVATWSQRAENDFMSMGHLLQAEPPIRDTAAFHAHQAAEKYLKAAIVWTRRAPPRTHALSELLQLCPARLRERDDLRRACRVLSRVLRRSRYPHEPEPTVEQARRAARAAAVVRDAVRTLIGSPDVKDR